MSPARFTASIVLAGLALSSCDRSPAPSAPTAPTASTAPRATLVAEKANMNRGAEPSATGHYEYGGFVTGNYFKYSFSAIQHADGSVSGEVEELVTVEATGEFVRRTHGDVDCVRVNGNRARISYRFDTYEGSPVVPPDRDHGIIAVVDNGEGADAVPDSAANSPGGITATRAQQFCEVGFVRPFREVEHGNIQVRP